jgi:hypothetical protein
MSVLTRKILFIFQGYFNESSETNSGSIWYHSMIKSFLSVISQIQNISIASYTVLACFLYASIISEEEYFENFSSLSLHRWRLVGKYVDNVSSSIYGFITHCRVSVETQGIQSF